MSLKLLSVGFALTALTVVLVPTTGYADAQSHHQARSHSIAERKGRIERSHAYREKFHDMRMKRFKHKKHHGGDDDLLGVPELDPNGIGAAATLLLGGVLVAQGRRRRLLLA